MSTQPFSSRSEKPTPFTTEATEEHREKFKSLLDEPWKVRLVPEPPRLPPGVLPAPEPHAVKRLPWRRGDVTRLKDDSPKGMMEYIATHTNGWWQELAERALRDTEKAERMAREAGWQPGQCWALEVDAEAKQKLLDAEEAKRQREEAERAKEAAEKEAFMQRQIELLKKAGKAPRCEYLYTDGRGCRAPQVKGERWCHGHAKAMSYRPENLEMELMEDEQAVMVNLYRVTKSLLAGRISEKTAGLMLWSVAIGAPSAGRTRKTHHEATEARRKGKNLPRIDADDRGSEGNHPTKPKTFATQRNGGNGGERKCRRELTRKKTLPLMNADATDRKERDTKHGHPGVTRRKSFRSGVRQRGRGLPEMPKLPKIAETETRKLSVSPCLRGEKTTSNQEEAQSRGSQWFRENSLNRHGQDQHSRGPSTPPYSPSTGSGSLGVGRDDSGKASVVDAADKGPSSVSPCLRGENNLRTTKPTEEEEERRGGGAD